MQYTKTSKLKNFDSAQKLKISDIRRILKKHKDVFEALENYDKTRTLPFQRKRIDITLSVETINKLKQLKEKTGKPISKIIEERMEKRREELPSTSLHAEQIPPAEPIPSYIC